mmetsp:Transcript_23790/g.51964  ORF Transcript_23790/g.51964 Transcript_23790/m.51964 type:complete len:461 (+) Transcript_23790:540-1922(+)
MRKVCDEGALGGDVGVRVHPVLAAAEERARGQHLLLRVRGHGGGKGVQPGQRVPRVDGGQVADGAQPPPQPHHDPPTPARSDGHHAAGGARRVGGQLPAHGLQPVEGHRVVHQRVPGRAEGAAGGHRARQRGGGPDPHRGPRLRQGGQPVAGAAASGGEPHRRRPLQLPGRGDHPDGLPAQEERAGAARQLPPPHHPHRGHAHLRRRADLLRLLLHGRRLLRRAVGLPRVPRDHAEGPAGGRGRAELVRGVSGLPQAHLQGLPGPRRHHHRHGLSLPGVQLLRVLQAVRVPPAGDPRGHRDRHGRARRAGALQRQVLCPPRGWHHGELWEAVNGGAEDLCLPLVGRQWRGDHRGELAAQERLLAAALRLHVQPGHHRSDGTLRRGGAPQDGLCSCPSDADAKEEHTGLGGAGSPSSGRGHQGGQAVHRSVVSCGFTNLCFATKSRNPTLSRWSVGVVPLH